MNHLVPCPECRRHVRAREATCPFCETELALASTAPPVLPRRRLERAALVAFGATLIGATALGCSDGDDDGGSGGTSASARTAGSTGNGGSSGSAGSGGSSGSAGSIASGGVDSGPPDVAAADAAYGGAPLFDAGPDTSDGSGP